jgi:poly(3-hydroxybutyrate) depolymerase
MKFSTVLAALAVLAVSASAANIPENLEKRQWGGFGGFGGGFGGGMGGGKSINDYKREQVAGRDIHVWVPANLPPKSPLLLSLHGMDQDPNYQQQNTHWETLADTEGFVVVYPRGGTGMSTWDISGTKDTNWVLQIIDQMAKEYDIDTNRVYLSGFSMGGMFTYNAMSKIADKIAAFAPCSGPNVMGASRAQRPVPIIHVHGTNDDVLPYAQIEGYLKNYRDQFHCPAQAKTETNYPNSENPNATMYTWGPCDDDVYIKHLKLQGRGHSPSQADIGDIWKFVSQYSLAGPVKEEPAQPAQPTQPTQPAQPSTPATKQLPTQSCPTTITAQGYKCCSDPNCIVYYTDADGTWGVEEYDGVLDWCGCGK